MSDRERTSLPRLNYNECFTHLPEGKDVLGSTMLPTIDYGDCVRSDLYNRYFENCYRINRLEAMKRTARQAILDKVVIL
jgi:hypothetical protein